MFVTESTTIILLQMDLNKERFSGTVTSRFTTMMTAIRRSRKHGDSWSTIEDKIRQNVIEWLRHENNAALYHQQWLLQCFGWASRLRCLSVVIAANWPRKREEDNWTWASVKRKETRATRKQGCSDASLLRCAAPDWPSESAFLHAKIPAARFRHPHPLLNTLPSRTISLSIKFPSLSFFASLSNTARTKPTRLLRLRAKSPKPRWLRDRPAFRFAWACLWVEPVIRWRGRASLYRSANVPTP